jgi:hypothetical protein
VILLGWLSILLVLLAWKRQNLLVWYWNTMINFYVLTLPMRYDLLSPGSTTKAYKSLHNRLSGNDAYLFFAA